MIRLLALLGTAAVAVGQNPPQRCNYPSGVNTFFYDMHDGDMKNAVLSDDGTLTITPHGNDEKWKVVAKVSTVQGRCVGTIDFNVPGKPNPPPFKVDVTLYTMWGYFGPDDSSYNTASWEFREHGTSFQTPPINTWISYPPVPPQGAALGWKCPDLGSLVAADMHDGDQKKITIVGRMIQIEPVNDKEKWIVKAELNKSYCGAMVDFRVPGKPNPPPCKLRAQVFTETPDGSSLFKFAIVFNDPENACKFPEPKAPLNMWVDTLNEEHSKDDGESKNWFIALIQRLWLK